MSKAHGHSDPRLSLVRSELNGRDLFSARGGRAISWEDVTPELFAGVDVADPSADIVEGGLGGTVNLRTRMPFDAKGQQFAFSADYTRGDLRKGRHAVGQPHSIPTASTPMPVNSASCSARRIPG